MMSVVAAKNPDWTWDEQLLAFDLYRRVGATSDMHPEVQALSAALRALPLHPEDARAPTFRNPAGVARKLADIHTHRPGYTGKPTNGSALDEAVWAHFGSDTGTVRRVAEQIRSITTRLPPEDDEDEVSEARPEGRLLYRLHRRYERDPNLKKRKVALARRRGTLRCEACGADPSALYALPGGTILECHHLTPLASTGETTTGIADVALLCPNCHRVAHRITPWPSLAQLRAVAAEARTRLGEPLNNR